MSKTKMFRIGSRLASGNNVKNAENPHKHWVFED